MHYPQACCPFSSSSKQWVSLVILLSEYTTFAQDATLVCLKMSRDYKKNNDADVARADEHTPAHTHGYTSIFSSHPLSVQSILASLPVSLTLSSESNLFFLSVLVFCPLMKSDVSFYASWLNLTEQWRERQDSGTEFTVLRCQCRTPTISLHHVAYMNTTFIRFFYLNTLWLYCICLFLRKHQTFSPKKWEISKYFDNSS